MQIFYVHADHLNTPRKVTQPSDNKRRWQWNAYRDIFEWNGTSGNDIARHAHFLKYLR